MTSGISTISTMTTPRSQHTMTMLPDGKVLIVGGNTSVSFTATPPGPNYMANPYLISTDTAEIYDPATGTFTATTGKLSEPRSAHAAILLPTGKVLIVGGRGEHGNDTILQSMIYNLSLS